MTKPFAAYDKALAFKPDLPGAGSAAAMFLRD